MGHLWPCIVRRPIKARHRQHPEFASFGPGRLPQNSASGNVLIRPLRLYGH